jgi:hypothetical protein
MMMMVSIDLPLLYLTEVHSIMKLRVYLIFNGIMTTLLIQVISNVSLLAIANKYVCEASVRYLYKKITVDNVADMCYSTLLYDSSHLLFNDNTCSSAVQ